MTDLESQIVAKFHAEILAAETTARGAIINDLYSFLGVVEKRISLMVAEAKPAATGIMPTLGRDAKAFEDGVKSVL